MEYGVLGLIVLILDIFAIVKTINSGADSTTKLIWVLVILFLPIIGLIAWWFAGPNRS